ncbi:hypothetical protein ACIQUS_09735 [Pseudomonas sp. NPDC090755]|uniref:hypothetical protein n=1 Tax=Pseudomonas sp. NPDC090755 TaxID=3364481 RepID=UPI00383B5CD9
MKTLIVDHAWNTIIARDAAAKLALAGKIQQIEDIEAAIRAVDGEEAARAVLNDGLIKHALTRCLEHLQGSASVTEKDFRVCYAFATTAASKAEQVIDEELSHIGS